LTGFRLTLIPWNRIYYEAGKNPGPSTPPQKRGSGRDHRQRVSRARLETLAFQKVIPDFGKY
jgi:hypothetical protein